MTEPFDPLDYANLSESITNALLKQPVSPLVNLPRFTGSGCYAIYYAGDHPTYEALADRNKHGQWSAPIYIGLSQDKGARTGIEEVEEMRATKSPLHTRLSKHAKSVEAAENLDENDFACRWLVTAHMWASVAEPSLIRRFQPAWNTLLAGGFGNNAPGGGRSKQKRSAWDTLHPGRRWATNLPDHPRSVESLEADVAEYVRSRWQV